MSRALIGTSGWSYAHWKRVFYPDGCTGTKMLPFYAQHFHTVELNASFYRLPKAITFDGWAQKTPQGFVFAVKASRFITHIKRLADIKQPWEAFIANASHLGEKLGPVLFQLPPSLKADTSVLDDFFAQLPNTLLYVLEPRNQSFFQQPVIDLMRRHNICLCVADSPRYPRSFVTTATFVYVRLHGSTSLYGSKYTDEELGFWADKVWAWLKQDLDVYVYFNNDLEGFAVENARTLMEMLGQEPPAADSRT
ncbi:MAG: DUF72 domain-containing protein [Candidatus Coatesbacteria bacterium]|nr:MAG: DUF72 domain-containing protein [Candidatus Coatesbacteria bacterium]